MRGDPVEPPFGCKPLGPKVGDKVRVTFEATVATTVGASGAPLYTDEPGQIRLSALGYAERLWGAKIEVIEKAPPPLPQVGDKVKYRGREIGTLLGVEGVQGWFRDEDGMCSTVMLDKLVRLP